MWTDPTLRFVWNNALSSPPCLDLFLFTFHTPALFVPWVPQGPQPSEEIKYLLVPANLPWKPRRTTVKELVFDGTQRLTFLSFYKYLIRGVLTVTSQPLVRLLALVDPRLWTWYDFPSNHTLLFFSCQSVKPLSNVCEPRCLFVNWTFFFLPLEFGPNRYWKYSFASIVMKSCFPGNLYCRNKRSIVASPHQMKLRPALLH